MFLSFKMLKTKLLLICSSGNRKKSLHLKKLTKFKIMKQLLNMIKQNNIQIKVSTKLTLLLQQLLIFYLKCSFKFFFQTNFTSMKQKCHFFIEILHIKKCIFAKICLLNKSFTAGYLKVLTWKNKEKRFFYI